MVFEKHARDEESGGVAEDKSGKAFEMGTSSNSRSFEVESWAFVAHQNYSLQLMQRVDPPLQGNSIPATLHETLAFFRVYTSAVCNSQLMPFVIYDFNGYMWNCVFNFIIKSLPLNYIYFFLSSYVPHEHMFVNKMVPLMYGYNVLMIFSLLTAFSLASETIILVLYYALAGVLYIAPWARCSQAFYFSIRFNRTASCLELNDLSDIALGKTSVFAWNSPFVLIYLNKGSPTAFTAPPLIFYHQTAQNLYFVGPQSEQIKFGVTVAVILLIIGLCRNLMYKRATWQVINYSNWIFIIFHLGALCHVFIISLETKIDVLHKLTLVTSSGRSLKYLDYEMFSDVIGVPPLLHFIASRNNRQKNPTEDSAVLVFSNFLNYTVKGIVLYMIRKYSENQYRLGFIGVSNINVTFIYWPIYLSLIPLGGLLGCGFFLLQGITEFLSFVIAYNIALECIQSAFPKLKWWLMLIITLLYVILFRMKIMPPGFFSRAVTFAIAKGFVTLVEMVIIICLYPIARLEDDITFHTGSPPAKLMSYAVRFTPVYFGVKLYLLISTQYETLTYLNNKLGMNYMMGLGFFLIAIPIIGILWPVVRNLCIRRQNWRSLFRPVPEWGPKDHIQRQLRKQYDSREYIASTASRYLSRYLKSKLTSRMYRLDVCYDTDRDRRRSTIAALQPYSYHIDDETKKDV